MGRPRPDFGGDGRWLAVFALITALEYLWWLLVWWQGIAPVPLLGTYLGFAAAAAGAALLVRRAAGAGPLAIPWPAAALGTVLVALAASAFLPLKYAIPAQIPFWLDRPAALAERRWFGADPWLLLDRTLGWAARPMDWLYGSWLPVQVTILFLVILSRPSAAKSRALVAYAMAWFLLGVVAATLLSSAGPVFYDRLFGGQDFAALGDTLRRRGAWIAIGESDRMYQSLASGRPSLVAGISAIPSIHVAISLWLYFVARTLAPRAAPLAMAYFILIWIGSVQLGWHYAIDGLAGALGMIALWWLATRWTAHGPTR